MEAKDTVRKIFDTEIIFHAAPERVFPLLCPVAEYDWIDGWSCDIIFAETGVAELGGVFVTRSREMGEVVWTISRYEPPRAIEFVRVAANVSVTKLDFALAPDGPERTAAKVRHTFTGLTQAGGLAIEQITQDRQETWARHLGAAANHYLATGQMLRKENARRS